ncbi:MAG: hypothetical protein ABIU95_02520 [Burkholderiales bacterium]
MSNALTEGFPSRPIKILVGSAPGGNADTAARVLGFEMAKTLAQPIIMAFKLGAAGLIAADAGA